MDVVVRWKVDAGRMEIAAAELWDNGATAVEVREEASTLVASFPTVAAAETVAARLGAIVEAVDPGWADAWRPHAQPVPVSGGLVVTPAWHPVGVDGGRLVVEIDPGRCFGSGSHPSTRLMLELLARRPIPPRVVDVGTGSGILAVVAARLGAKVVTAVDVDPDAMAVVEANARRNGVASRVVVSTTPVGALEGPFDLALVNVTAGVHAEVGPRVEGLLRSGGRIFVAGLLPGQWEHVATAYAACEVVEHHHLDGWAGAVLECGGPG